MGDHRGQQFTTAVERERIVALQFLRGVAASLVVAYHLIERYVRRGAFPADVPEWVARMGEVGVLTFFAISGFIMVYTTASSPDRRVGGWAFLRNRFFRIAPLYYLTTLLIVGFRLATASVSTKPDFDVPTLQEWLLSFLFIPHRNIEGDLQPIYKLGWTLNYEMFFYLLFALGLGMRSQRTGLWLIILLLCGLVAAGSLIPEPAESLNLTLVVYFFTRPILIYFVLGMLLGLVFLQLRSRRISVSPLWQCAAASAALALALIGGPDLSFPAVGVAIAAVTLFREKAGTTPHFARFAQAFGDASYSMYLTHSFLLGAFAAATARFTALGTAPLVALVLLGCAVSFAFSWVVWRTIEVPITKLLRGKQVPATFSASVAP